MYVGQKLGLMALCSIPLIGSGLAQQNAGCEQPIDIVGFQSGTPAARGNVDAIIAACRAALDAKRNDPERMFQLGRALTAGGRHREAIQLFFDAADRLHVGAMTELGVMFEFGRGVPTNLATANTWYKRAADDGSPQAMNELGRWNENGTNGDIDLDAAKVWYEKAAALGSAAALNRLGEFYEEGRGVPQSLAAARDLYVKAAGLGLPRAMTHLGHLNEIGLSVPANLASARQWYERAVGLGDPDAMAHLGWLLENSRGAPNLTAAKEWYDKGAAMGSALAMANLAALFEHGRGVSQNLVQARLWYERAAALELPRALNALGQLYLTGGGGPRNFSLAKELFEKAAARGDAAAMTNIGLLYLNGRGVERDEAEASSWFIKAAALGDQTAQSNLSRMKEALRAGYSSLAAQVVARRAECFQACRSLHRTYVDTVCQQHFSTAPIEEGPRRDCIDLSLRLSHQCAGTCRNWAQQFSKENSCQACFQALIQCSQKRGERNSLPDQAAEHEDLSRSCLASLSNCAPACQSN